MPQGTNQPSGLPERAGRATADFSAEVALRAIQLFAVDGVGSGIFPGEGKVEAKMQVGHKSVTTDGNGQVVVWFKKPFPGGCGQVVAWTNGGPGRLLSSSVNGFTMFGLPASLSVVVDYIAVGW